MALSYMNKTFRDKNFKVLHISTKVLIYESTNLNYSIHFFLEITIDYKIIVSLLNKAK